MNTTHSVRLLVGVSLALTGCGPGGLKIVPTSGETDSDQVEAAAADVSGVDRDIARNTIRKTTAGIWVRDLPKMPREKMATLLSYRAMDNDLGPIALVAHLNNLEEAGSSTYANLLVFADGPEDGDSRTYYTRHDRSSSLISPYLHPGGSRLELNSADPQTLQQFVSFGYSRYPGRFRVLDVSSHGGGYQGMCADYSSNYQQMSLDHFGEAIKHGLKGRKLAVLNLLACLMGAIEVAYEFRDVASVLVASEDNLMGDDVDLVLNYDETFGRIAASQSREIASAQALGRAIVQAARPERARSGAFTLAAIDMEQIAGVKRQMNVLSRALLGALPTHRAAIIETWNGTPFMYRDANGISSHRDLIEFAKRLRNGVADPAVRNGAAEVVRAIKQLVLVFRRKGPENGLANGLSIYMPATDEAFNPAYHKTRFARDTAWDEVILAIQGR